MPVTFECCEWGDGAVVDEYDEPIYPHRCGCICHTPEEWEYY
jgi:hypothetical protein